MDRIVTGFPAPIESPAAITPERIEEVGLNALQTQRQLFYDGWLLRLSPGTAKRARSINPHFASRLPLDEKIAHCESLYARCGLPVLFRITPFAQPPELVSILSGRGYVAFDASLVQTLSLDQPPEFSVPVTGSARVVDPAAFAEAAGGLRGSTQAQRDAHLERLKLSPLVSRLVVIEVDGAVVCTAQMAMEDDVAGIFDVLTLEASRGKGHATHAVGKLLAWAWERAARVAYLQVTATNAAALAVYGKFGCSTLYSYCYYARPGDCR